MLNRLADVSREDTLSVFERIPESRISTLAVEFAQKMLEVNRSRLIGLREEL